MNNEGEKGIIKLQNCLKVEVLENNYHKYSILTFITDDHIESYGECEQMLILHSKKKNQYQHYGILYVHYLISSL